MMVPIFCSPVRGIRALIHPGFHSLRLDRLSLNGHLIPTIFGLAREKMD